MKRKSKSIYLVTSNKDKFREFRQILGIDLKRADLELEEIQAIEVEKVIMSKTKQAFGKIKEPVICEDSGLYFEEWGGLPGALIKLFEENLGYGKICELLSENRKALAKTVVSYFNGKNYQSFIGKIEGKIAKTPQGKGGFGWDTIFIPKGFENTFAQMSLEQKNEISMRRIAAEKLKKFLIKNEKK